MSIHEFLGAFGFGLLFGIAVGGFAGYMLATHIHSVANAASRALTIPQGDVAALNAKIDGLGSALQSVAQSVAKPAAAAIGALPQPAAATAIVPAAVIPPTPATAA